MNPVIFPHDATEFTTQGWGTLNCISCFVTEERNGIYELEAKVPLTSPRFDKIVEGNIIVATHSNKGDRQPFQIYGVSRAIDGIVTVRAEHISYRLNKNVVMPYTASGIQAALSEIPNHTVDTCPFTFETDKTSAKTFSSSVPKSVKSMLFGSDGSIVDAYSTGDYEFDLFTVRLWEDRGEDNQVVVRYGRNLTDILQETDISDIYTAIVPYWQGADENGDEKVVMLSDNPQLSTVVSDYVNLFPTRRTVAVDLSDKFEEMPTVAELKSAAQSYVNGNVRRQLVTTVRASYIELSQTDQYKNLYEREKVNLCDTVTVVYDALGIDEKLKVTEIVYNVLADRNEKITLGNLKKSLANVLNGGSTAKAAQGAAGKSAYQSAVDNGFVGSEAEWVASLGGGKTEFLVEKVTAQYDKQYYGLRVFSDTEYLNYSGDNESYFRAGISPVDIVVISKSGYTPLGVVGFGPFTKYKNVGSNGDPNDDVSWAEAVCWNAAAEVIQQDVTKEYLLYTYFYVYACKKGGLFNPKVDVYVLYKKN